MAANTDIEPVLVTNAELHWLTFAVRNLQTRSAGESAMRQQFIADIAAKQTDQPQYALPLTPELAMLLLWSVNDGNCRNNGEMAIRGRLQARFNELTGGHWGINGTQG